MLSCGSTEHACIRHADHIDDELDLLTLIGSWEKWETGEKFDHDAAKAPHVDLLGVRENTKHDVWGSVKPTLYIGIDDFIFKAP